MELMDKQKNHADKECLTDCHCKIKMTHGLPCAHDITLYRVTGKPIPLNAIHIHWRTLSLQALEHIEDGVKPNKSTQLIERLNEMDPSSQDSMISMIDKLFDMTDPSRCTIRPPVYNTEQKGQPKKRDEQNSDRRPSFSVSTSEYKASRIPRSQWKNGEDNLIRRFPQRYQCYISHFINIRADGHYGFRAIAAQLHSSEDDWAQVRLNLMQEITQNWDMYNHIYHRHGWTSILLEGLNYFEQPVQYTHWMDAVPMGVLIASAYNIVLHTFDEDVEFYNTHLPVRSPAVPFVQCTHIAIGRVNGNHFVQVFLYPDYLVPSIINWRYSGQSDEWAHHYHARIQLWYDVMGIDRPGQHVHLDLD